MGNNTEIYEWNSDSQETATSLKPIRKCLDCGLEIYSEKDLKLFIKNGKHKYGYRNLCKKCHILRVKKRFENMTKEEKEKDKEYHRVWEKTNIKRRNSKKNRMYYKNKGISFDFNLRTNVCCICGKKYPKNLKRQTDLHHIKYLDDNPLGHTVELCVGCHFKIHKTKNSQLVPIGGGKYKIQRQKSNDSTGIYKEKNGKWCAFLYNEGKHGYLGLFPTYGAAQNARNNAIEKLNM